MKLEEINKNLNKLVVYKGVDGIYKLTACIKKRDSATKKIYYRVELLDTKNGNSVLIAGLEDIAESEKNEMDIFEISNKLKSCFPRSLLYQGKFYPFAGTTHSFNLDLCKSEIEVKSKVLAWFSRAAFKGEPFDNLYKNSEYQEYMLNGINAFLEIESTERALTAESMELIYTKVGNDINRELCERFIKSGYDLTVLKEGANND